MTSRRVGWLVFFLTIMVGISVVGSAMWSLRASPSSSSSSSSSSCFFLSSVLCNSLNLKMRQSNMRPPPVLRPRTDAEISSLALSRYVLSPWPERRTRWARPKLAFLFLTRAALPHESLWELFFQVVPILSFPLFTSLSLFFFSV